MSPEWQNALVNGGLVVLGALLGGWFMHRAGKRHREDARIAREEAEAAREEAEKRLRRGVKEAIEDEGRRIEMVATMLRHTLPGTPEGLPAGPHPTTLSIAQLAIDSGPLLRGDRRAETAFLDDGTRERVENLATALARYTTRTSRAKEFRTAASGLKMRR
jgi:hypothetical protein